LSLSSLATKTTQKNRSQKPQTKPNKTKKNRKNKENQIKNEEVTKKEEEIMVSFHPKNRKMRFFGWCTSGC
jgi:hypothetical protein